MRSIDEVRELLGSAAEGKTDAELEEIRATFYRVADVLVAEYMGQALERRDPGCLERAEVRNVERFRRRRKRKGVTA